MSAEQGSSKVLTLTPASTSAATATPMPEALTDLAGLPAQAVAAPDAPPGSGPDAGSEFGAVTSGTESTTDGAAGTVSSSTPDVIDTRTLSRSLFLRLRALDNQGTGDSPERTYVRDTLIELNLPLVRYAAARFRSRNEPMEDIVQVGTIGLIKAIDRFDCERGVEFPTFAMPTVVGEIKRFFRDTSWSVRVPRRLQELRLALTKASDELSQRLDRSPTVPELAAVLGVSEEDVVDGLAVGNAYTASSLDSPSPEDDGGEGSLADRLGYEDSALEGVEYRESLKPLLAKLPPRERQIIMLRFFANMTQSQIGEEVGISQMHVSRLLTRTLAQLRQGLTAD
ncbi:RNA polymerase sigma factor SigF [Streptomyces qinzhouensis]|uniref:SigB/SigF/SigG family RNA polymerase sigma factor n=1 Tax=Streptomyces qinzhouensis TaxID=2599401 RepID=A0A5B8JKL2_9ACTN|nr:RNA polymerase sigma factor SigF [Streptomyces qinzhouensis]QDY81064.1 SigB/SigF/SigG family RNA polymerase sigma factor [Streptomyces qinzhouensis]